MLRWRESNPDLYICDLWLSPLSHEIVNGEVVPRTTVRHLSPEELINPEWVKLMTKYDDTIVDKL